MSSNILYLTAEMAKDSSLNLGDKFLLARFIDLCTMKKATVLHTTHVIVLLKSLA